MTLHLIGIGYKKSHINLEQLEIIKKSKKIFLEYYTSFFENSFEELEELFEKKINICYREDIEILIEKKILELSKKEDISLLIIGDPLIATTHSDLILRCYEKNIEIKIYQNISVLNLIGRCGLSLYKFGKITSIPFYNDKFMPKTPFIYLLENNKIKAHTLFLLDLNPKENKYLDIKSSLNFFLKIQKKIEEDEEHDYETNLVNENTKFIMCSKLGFKDEKIIFSSLKKLIELDKKFNFEPPLCLIYPNNLNEIEKLYLKKFEK